MGARISKTMTIDIRRLSPAKRHSAVFSMFDGLRPGQAFVFINDREPARLRNQFEALFPEEHTWTYLLQGPAEWRVEIGRPLPEPSEIIRAADE